MHEYRTTKMRKCRCMKFLCIISGCPAGARKWQICHSIRAVARRHPLFHRMLEKWVLFTMPKPKWNLNIVYISERLQESLRPISRCAMTTVVAPMGR